MSCLDLSINLSEQNNVLIPQFRIFRKPFFLGHINTQQILSSHTDAIPERVHPGARGAVLWGPFWACVHAHTPLFSNRSSHDPLDACINSAVHRLLFSYQRHQLPMKRKFNKSRQSPRSTDSILAFDPVLEGCCSVDYSRTRITQTTQAAVTSLSLQLPNYWRWCFRFHSTENNANALLTSAYFEGVSAFSMPQQSLHGVAAAICSTTCPTPDPKSMNTSSLVIPI